MGKKTLIISLLLLIISLALMEFTNVDFYLQDKLYDFAHKRWYFQDPTQIYYLIFYQLIKIPIYIIAVFALFKVGIGIKQKNILAKNRPFLIVALSLILLPAGIATIGKKSINVQCPYDIPRYGGSTPYVRLLEPYPINPNRPDGKWPPGNCFPAGHASGGFALLSLYLVFNSRKKKMWAIIFAMSFGTIMSIYQMVRGSHYLLHQVVTFLLALILISFLNIVIKKEKINESENN